MLCPIIKNLAVKNKSVKFQLLWLDKNFFKHKKYLKI